MKVKLIPMQFNKEYIALVDSMKHTIIIIKGIERAKQYKNVYEKHTKK